MKLTINPLVLPQSLTASVTIPGDKSISHRALMIGSISNGISEFTNLLESADIEATKKLVQALGVTVHKEGRAILVHGQGLARFSEPKYVLEMGNSGTTIRLGLGLVGPSKVFTVFSGDASLNNRPMDRVIKPLSALGLSYVARANNSKPPVVCLPPTRLTSASVTGTVPSAQVKSAFLLAAVQIPGSSSYYEPTPTRNHTELMLLTAGANLETTDGLIKLSGGKDLGPISMQIPGDPSSAAFWTVAALLRPNTQLTIRNVGVNPRRIGYLSVLRRMGGKITLRNHRIWGGEEVADLEVVSSKLHGCEISPAEIPDLIDEIPILAVAAAVAAGRTRITGAGELRVKESDRIKSIVTEFAKLGINVTELSDGLEIIGSSYIRGGNVTSHHDHRIAMALAILALVADSPVTVHGAEAIAISYPEFEATFTTLFGSAALQKILD